MSGPITVGMDGSAGSLHAVEWAAREAALHGSALRIVFVPAQSPQMSWHQPGSRLDGVADAAHQAYAGTLASAAERAAELEPGLTLSTELLSGPPARTLAETTADASMLVVGSRGAGLFSALRLGSVSRYAAAHGECPVVVERDETTAAYREVVVGVGDLDESAAALGFAFEEAALRHARLVVIHAWSCFVPAPLPGGPQGVSERAGTGAGHLYHGMAARLEDTLDGWREKYPGVETSTEIMHAHPGRLLVGASARADLVVLGRSGGGTDGSSVGSVIHAVLHHAHGPVAVVPG